MGAIVTITKIPPLDSVVIKQKNGHLFISAPNSIIIDRGGIIRLIQALVNVGFLAKEDIERIVNEN